MFVVCTLPVVPVNAYSRATRVRRATSLRQVRRVSRRSSRRITRRVSRRVPRGVTHRVTRRVVPRRRVVTSVPRRRTRRAARRRLYSLPSSHTTVVRAGATYYVSGGVHYVQRMEAGRVIYIEIRR